MSINLRLERSTSQNVAMNTNVLFDNIPLLDGAIAYDSATGVITVNQAGTFIINWTVSTVSTVSTNGTVFALITSNGERIVNNNCRRTGETSGFGIIKAETPGVTISLVNASSAPVMLQSVVPIKASLTLFEEGQGAIEVMGMQAQLQGSADTIHSRNDPVIFDTILNDTADGISYDNAGTFTISRNGRFLINWSVSVSGANALPIGFSLNVNGVQYSRGMASIPDAQILSSDFLVVDSAPVTVSLTNDSAGDIMLQDIPLQANIVITGWAT